MRKFSFLACAMLLGVGALVADDSAGLNSRSNSQDLRTNLFSTGTENVLLADATNAVPFNEQTPGDVSATYRLDAVEINSVGDDISRSGISEGFLNKRVASGPLDNKKAIEMPYQVNTLTREMLDNQGIQTSDEIFKYLPSAQLQWRGGSEQGRPQTRGFQGSVVGNSFWDGFYSVSTTAIPMAMFESVQVQNGLAGSLYGGQEPSGIFSYQRKRPIKDYIAIWGDFTSYGNFGVGIDGSDKTDKMGFRGVLYTADGERQPQGNNINRNLASFALDFYPADNLTFETNFSYYKHISKDNYKSASVYSVNGRAITQPITVNNTTYAPGIPIMENLGTSIQSERFMRTTTASGKVKYMPYEYLYLEGGYQWQEAVRSRNPGQSGGQRFVVPNWFAKAQSEFETGIVSHNIAASVNGYKWIMGTANVLSSETKNFGLLYDIGITDYVELVLSGSNSWFYSPETRNASGTKTAEGYNKTGISYGGSFIVKPLPNRLSFYVTYADSLISGTAHTYGLGSNGTINQSHPKAGEVAIISPYRSKMYEFGVKGRVMALDISAAIFQITRPIFYEANYNFGRQGDQRNRGIELMVGGMLNENLSTIGGVTLLQAKMNNSVYREAENKYMIGEPKIQANVLFDYIVPSIRNLSLNTNLHYTHKRYVDEVNTLSVPSYFTMDVGARYITKNLIGKETSFRFNINNIFNKKYWAGMFPGELDGELSGTNTSPNSTSLFRSYDRTFMASVMVKF